MNLEHFRPLLAATIKNDEQLDSLRYPLIASPKIDGIRVIIHPTLGPVTRSLKPVGNKHIRFSLALLKGTGFDGEVTVGPNHGSDVFANTTGAVRRESGLPNFTYWVFDRITDHATPYKNRFIDTHVTHVKDLNWPFLRILDCRVVHTAQQVKAYEVECLAQGYEGIMLRSPDSRYKFGRSTISDQILMKLKRFQDAEATVIGFETLQRNNNKAETNALGLTERSHHKEGLEAANLLGTLLVKNEEFGEFGIGTGFSEEQRREIWYNQEKYIGETVTFRYQSIGTVNKPRFPSFMRFRSRE